MDRDDFRGILRYGLLCAVTGILVSAIMHLILFSIAFPNYTSTILPKTFSNIEMKVGYFLAERGFPIACFFGFILIILIIYLIILFLKRLNPTFTWKNIKSRKAILRILLVFILSAISVSLIVLVFQSLESPVKTKVVKGLIKLIGEGIGGCILWYCFSEKGLLGDISSKEWTSLKNIKSGLKFSLWGGLAAIIAGIIFFIFPSQIRPETFPFLFSIYLGTSELSLKGLLLSLLFSSPFWALPGFLRGITCYYLAKPSNKMSRLVPGILLFIIVTLGGAGMLYYCNTTILQYDYQKDFLSALQVSKKPSKTYTLFCFKENKAIPKAVELRVKVFSYFEERINVNVNKENIKKAILYLKKKDYKTYHLNVTYEYIYTAYLMDWDLKSALRTLKESIDKGGSVLDSTFMVVHLRKLQASPGFISLVDYISDESKFYIGGKFPQRLGDVYWHFGKIDKAKYWYKKAGKDEVCLKKKKPVFIEGVVIGKIYLNDKPVENIKVALVDEFVGEDFNKKNYQRFFDYLWFTATSRTKKDGSFKFTYITSDGDYLLMIRDDKKILGDNPKKVKFYNISGKIKISKKEPVRNLGIIKIYL